MKKCKYCGNVVEEQEFYSSVKVCKYTTLDDGLKLDELNNELKDIQDKIDVAIKGEYNITDLVDQKKYIQYQIDKLQEEMCQKETNGKDFVEQTLNNLKEEVAQLNKLLIKNRLENNHGTYKNLILAYKEIVNIIKDIEDNDNQSSNIIYNLNIESDNSNVDMMKVSDYVMNKLSNELKKSGIRR